MGLNRSKLKATELAFVDTNNIEYIVHDFERQGLVARTKDQLKSALSKLGSNNGTICIVDSIDVDEDLTIPENISLKFFNGGILNVLTQDIPDEDVGTGDGSTTEFSLAYSPVLENSETIYIDGTEQTRNTDYTINYENGVITFTSAPANGASITAEYTRRFKLTINGGIDAGLFQIFDGDGFVTGNPKIEAVYPEWFGAKGDGVTDDTKTIQKTINFAAWNHVPVKLGSEHYKFTKLYFYYDSENNPDFPTNTGEKGDFIFRGNGYVRPAAIKNGYYKYTVLESTDSTGPAFIIKNEQYDSSNYIFENFTLITNNTTQAIYFHHTCVQGTKLKDLMVKQNGSGDGIYVKSSWVCEWENVYVEGNDSGNSGTGIVIEVDSGEIGGGLTNLYNVTSRYFKRGWRIGKETYGDGNLFTTVNCIGCQASHNSEYGVLIGHGARNVNWLGSFIESATNDTNTCVGLWLKSNCYLPLIKGSWFTHCDIAIRIGDPAGGEENRYVFPMIEQCSINDLYVTGIEVYTGFWFAAGAKISNCYITPDSSAPGDTTGIWLQDSIFHGLTIENNYLSPDLTYDIVNKDRIQVFINNTFAKSGGYASLQKRGVFKTFPSNDTTPSVADSVLFKTNNGEDTIITTFDDGVEAQEIIIIFNDNHTTLKHGEGIILKSGADKTFSVNETIRLVYDGSYWYEV